jgi:hypothetical protein
MMISRADSAQRADCQPLYVYLPRSLNLTKALPVELWHYQDHAAWLVGTLFEKQAKRKNKKRQKEFCLMATFLRRIMGRKYNEIIKHLVAADVITRGGYLKGVSSRAYAIHDRFAVDPRRRVELKDRNLLVRIRRWYAEREQQERSRWSPIHFDLERLQKRLTIDDRMAEDLLATTPMVPEAIPLQQMLLDRIRNGEFYFSLGKTERVYNAIAALKRELRAALRVDGERLVEIDLKCCQPSLLAELVKSWLNELVAPERQSTLADDRHAERACQEADRPWGPSALDRYNDEQKRETATADATAHSSDTNTSEGTATETRASDINPLYVAHSVIAIRGGYAFIRLIENDQFYRSMGKYLRRDGYNYTNKQVKRLMQRDVISKKSGYFSPIEEAFRRRFEVIIDYIRQINDVDHKTLVHLLQRLEAELVIGTICNDLAARHPDMFLCTLHDCVLVKESDVDRATEAFDRALSDRGVKMRYKVKSAVA